MLRDQSLAAKYSLMDQYTSPVKKAEREIVGREKEMTRLMAAMCRPELCNAILLADAGSGKALDNGTPIPAIDNGRPCFKPMGELRPGDTLFDSTGHLTTVLKVFPQGTKRAYAVKFEDGHAITCNDEHLWNVRTESEVDACSPWHTESLRTMLDNPGQDYYVPVSGRVAYPEAKQPVPAYLMGVLLVMGRFDKDHVQILCDDEWCVRRAAGLINAVPVRVSHGLYEMAYADGTFVTVNELVWRGLKLDAMQWDSGDRAVPEAYLFGSLGQRTDFLHGLMDAGGMTILDTDVGCSVRFRAHGAVLSSVMRQLAASLGIRTYLMRFDGTGERDDVLFIPRGETASAILDFFRTLFWSPRAHARLSDVLTACEGRVFHSVRAYDSMRVTEIRDLGVEVPMTCIYVNSPSHLFLCGRSYAVTHNTALVQGTMLKDTKREYLEVDLARMITACTTDANQMAALLKGLFDEVADYCKSQGQEVVLFIDEFHQVVQLSDAAVEALKPLLADSGTRGIRIIAATTYIEFRKYIAPNQPLVERLQRINLPEPGHDVVISILKGMASRYGVAGEIRGDNIYELIYEYTNRYIPSNAQPRKSILIMDAMIGWHNAFGRKFDDKLLADVIYDSEGVKVNFSVDASRIKQELDKRVLSQKFATSMIEQRLQICAADLNNKKKPMSSFLFSGSTGTGKELPDSTLIPVFSPIDGVVFKKNGDLRPGDFVFNREGYPVEVLGVFPQGVKPVYEVELTDGRVLRTGAQHLWTYKSRYGNGSKYWRMTDTETLMDKVEKPGYVRPGGKEKGIQFVIPMNQAVTWPAADLPVDPYVVGALIGNGCLREKALGFSSDDRFVVDKIAERIGAVGVYKDSSTYTWGFYLPENQRQGNVKRFQAVDVLVGPAAALVGLYSHEKFIPDEYKHGSIEQRWALVQGLFDTDGHVGSNDRYNVSYSTTSERLVRDVQHVLHSLGVSSRISNHGIRKGRTGNVHDEWHLHVMVGNQDKHRFFSLPRKMALCDAAVAFESNKKRVKKFGDVIGVRHVRRTDDMESMTCIMVDDPEHLYQAGDFIVTHNTEVTKSLANLLFGSDDAMIRFDCTEFANPDSLERFRHELTNRVWARPFSIILLDEIEKACAPVTRLLLQVLDDGRLMDENNRVVVFSNAYIVLTTNAGSEVYKNISQYNADDEGSGKDIMKYYKVIRESIASTTGDNRFPPELLGRIDVIVPFQPLSEKTMKQIAQMNLMKMIQKVKDRHGVSVEIHKNVIRYLVEDNLDTDSDSGGARVVISKMESEVTIPIARFINENPGVRRLRVRVKGTLVRDDQNVRVSDAYIVVVDADKEDEEKRKKAEEEQRRRMAAGGGR